MHNVIGESNIVDMYNKAIVEKGIAHCNIECALITDLNLSPRGLDKEYAESIPMETPPIRVGVIMDKIDPETNEKVINKYRYKFILLDGSHRLYSKKFIFNQKNINVEVTVYEDIYEAGLAAYKFNTTHGKPLTDREVAKGVLETMKYLKMKNREITYEDVGAYLNITSRQVRLYQYWYRVEKEIGAEIAKTKADLLHPFIHQGQMDELRKFWDENKGNTVRELTGARRHFLETGEIVNFKTYSIEKILEEKKKEKELKEEEEKITNPTTEIVEEKVENKVELTGKAIQDDKSSDILSGFMAETGLIGNGGSKFSGELDEEDKEDLKNRMASAEITPKTKMHLDKLALNVLDELQDEMLDKCEKMDSISALLTKSDEDLEKMKSKKSELEVYFFNITTGLNKMKGILNKLN